MIATVLQKWLMATVFLGAGVLVLTHPRGFGAFAAGVERVVGGTTSTIIRGR
jgi:hypothetical protein